MPEVKFIEATQDQEAGFNWGKFAVMRFSAEDWAHRSQITPEVPLLSACGWGGWHLWVLDLQTGEGVYVQPGGVASADLEKHRVWVCPMYEPFLTWLYTQDLSDLSALPDVVELPDAPAAVSGYRRPGPVSHPGETMDGTGTT